MPMGWVHHRQVLDRLSEHDDHIVEHYWSEVVLMLLDGEKKVGDRRPFLGGHDVSVAGADGGSCVWCSLDDR